MKTLTIALLAALALLPACSKNSSRPAEGPMERAGKKVDQTGQKANEDVQQMGDDVDAKTKKAKEDAKKKL